LVDIVGHACCSSNSRLRRRLAESGGQQKSRECG
jgi:hypothetical protein